ncbi:hypothetical protein, partial, partial [Parasitella parasitica]
PEDNPADAEYEVQAIINHRGKAPNYEYKFNKGERDFQTGGGNGYGVGKVLVRRSIALKAKTRSFRCAEARVGDGKETARRNDGLVPEERSDRHKTT